MRKLRKIFNSHSLLSYHIYQYTGKTLSHQLRIFIIYAAHSLSLLCTLHFELCTNNFCLLDFK